MRRAPAASPLNCSPATCSPVANVPQTEAGREPAAVVNDPPVSTNWALTVRQASRLGAASGLPGFSGKAEGLIGDRKIERAMSLAMTAPTLAVSPASGVMAMVTGLNSPPRAHRRRCGERGAASARRGRGRRADFSSSALSPSSASVEIDRPRFPAG